MNNLPSALPPPLHTIPDNTHPRHRRMLIRGLIVAILVCLLSIGVAIWWLVKDSAGIVGSSGAVQQATNAGTENIKNVQFVAPALPAPYVRRDQNTLELATTYYANSDTNCVITTKVASLGGSLGATPKEVIMGAAHTAETAGVTTVKSTDGPVLRLASTGSNTYDFSTIELEQNMSLPGVNFTKQYNIIAFKQFGRQVASIGYSCKADTWAATKEELKNLATSFKVKTER